MDGGPGGGSEEARLIERFLKGYDSEQTRRAYRNDLTGFFGGEATSEEAREVAVKGVRNYLREEAGKYGFETIRRRASSLAAFFEWLEEEGLAEKNLLAEAPGPAALARQAQQHANGEAPDVEDREETGGQGPPGDEEPSAENEAEMSPSAEEAPSTEEIRSTEEEKREDAPSRGSARSEGPAIGPAPFGETSEGTRRPEEQSGPEGRRDLEEPEGESTEAGPDDDRPGETDGELGPAAPDGDVPGGLSLTELLSDVPSGDVPPGTDSPGGEPPTEDPHRDTPSPEGFPEDFLEVPPWAEATLKVQIGTSIRFTGEALEEGMDIQLRSVPAAVAHGLSLLADAERFPEGAIERPYYRLTGPEGEWMMTLWRTGGEDGDGEKRGAAQGEFTFLESLPFVATGLAARLTFAKPLMEAKNRKGEAPAPESEAARLLWLLHGRGWTLTESLYDLLESAIGLPFGRKGPEEGGAPTKRFEEVGTEEAREAVALEVATLLSKGLGLSKRDEVQIGRTTW